jgi:hypothetical protein
LIPRRQFSNLLTGRGSSIAIVRDPAPPSARQQCTVVFRRALLVHSPAVPVLTGNFSSVTPTSPLFLIRTLSHRLCVPRLFATAACLANIGQLGHALGLVLLLPLRPSLRSVEWSYPNFTCDQAQPIASRVRHSTTLHTVCQGDSQPIGPFAPSYTAHAAHDGTCTLHRPGTLDISHPNVESNTP